MRMAGNRLIEMKTKEDVEGGRECVCVRESQEDGIKKKFQNSFFFFFHLRRKKIRI